MEKQEKAGEGAQKTSHTGTQESWPGDGTKGTRSVYWGHQGPYGNGSEPRGKEQRQWHWEGKERRQRWTSGWFVRSENSMPKQTSRQVQALLNDLLHEADTSASEYDLKTDTPTFDYVFQYCLNKLPGISLCCRSENWAEMKEQEWDCGHKRCASGRSGSGGLSSKWVKYEV